MKKKICQTCNKQIKDYCKKQNECDTCNRTRLQRTSPRHFLMFTYRGIKARCTNPKSGCEKYYYGKEFCTKEEFINMFIKNSSFLKLYKRWQKLEFIYKEIPSINRLNNSKGYTLDNINFITHSKNAGIDKDKLPIIMYDLNGNFIKEYESKWAAHKELGIPNGNICKVVYGQRKSAGGYVFKFKT